MNNDSLQSRIQRVAAELEAAREIQIAAERRLANLQAQNMPTYAAEVLLQDARLRVGILKEQLALLKSHDGTSP
jgi:hypothetical protein